MVQGNPAEPIRSRADMVVLSRSRDGWNDSYRLRRHTYRAHAEARMLFVKGTAWLGAIKDIDLVSLFLLHVGGG